MSIKDRLQMVIKMNNLTNASFADRVGVQRSSISHIMAGRNKPSLDFIQKTLLAFPKVDAHWLISGKQGTAKEQVSYENDRTESSYHSEKKERIDIESNRAPAATKDIDRIVVFYTDGTYTETKP